MATAAPWNNPGGASTSSAGDYAVNPAVNPYAPAALAYGARASPAALGAPTPALAGLQPASSIGMAVDQQIKQASGTHDGKTFTKQLDGTTHIPPTLADNSINVTLASDPATAQAHFANEHVAIAQDNSLVKYVADNTRATIAEAHLEVTNGALYGIRVHVNGIGNPNHTLATEHGVSAPCTMYVPAGAKRAMTLVANPNAAAAEIYMGRAWTRAQMDALMTREGKVVTVRANHPIIDVAFADVGATNEDIKRLYERARAEREMDEVGRGASYCHSGFFTPEVYDAYCSQIEERSHQAASKITNPAAITMSYSRADGRDISDPLPAAEYARGVHLEEMNDAHANRAAEVVHSLNLVYAAPSTRAA